MAAFNAQRARAKRPCPLWVDAFQRDTQHLGADEVGAYMLILMAMWTREACDFPDDDKRLAQVTRISPRLWKSRMGPVLREFFTAEDGSLISKRLRQEARYVEDYCRKQSDRKAGALPESGAYAEPTVTPKPNKNGAKKSDKALKKNKLASSTDATPDEPRGYPTQQPNNPTGGGEDKSSPPPSAAGDLPVGFEDDLADALGLEDAEPLPPMWLNAKGRAHMAGWLKAHTPDRILAVARESRKRHPEVPASPQALDPHLAKPPAAAPARRAEPIETARFWAERIGAGKFIAPSSINPEIARLMLAEGLVTEDQLREKGIAA